MTNVRLYFDEDACEHAVINGLRIRNVDLLTTLEANRLGTDDEEQLRFATSHDRAIYSFNVKDFARIHREYLNARQEHRGIILIPDQRYSVGTKTRRIAEFVYNHEAEELINQIVFL